MMMIDDVVVLFRSEDDGNHVLTEKLAALFLAVRLTPALALCLNFPHANGDLGRTQACNGDRRENGVSKAHSRLLNNIVFTAYVFKFTLNQSSEDDFVSTFDPAHARWTRRSTHPPKSNRSKARGTKTTTTRKLPVPKINPMQAVSHTHVAVVRPLTRFCVGVWIITPAPRKPIP